MRTTDAAIENDLDWTTTLRRYREDPMEGYLHTVLPMGEVLPFSEAVAIAYEYPCTLGKQQDGLHKRLVFKQYDWHPLNHPSPVRKTPPPGSAEECLGASIESERPGRLCRK